MEQSPMVDDMVYRHSVVVVRGGNGREGLWGSPSITEGKIAGVWELVL